MLSEIPDHPLVRNVHLAESVQAPVPLLEILGNAIVGGMESHVLSLVRGLTARPFQDPLPLSVRKPTHRRSEKSGGRSFHLPHFG
jgi:hypothetical protein